MTTKEFSRSIITSCLALFAFVQFAHADPENFMVGNYTFPRPERWQWIELPVKATVSAKMILPNDKGGELADVVFVESRFGSGWASADETIGRWKKNFMESAQKQNQDREERKFAKTKVTFFWQEGTYKSEGSGGVITAKSDFAQYGVIIDNGTNNILARVLGDRTAVSKAKDGFKKMVEKALAEQE